ncbi:MAG TPA: glycosyltransferase [Pyrinomonadaceae bacterium]|nr:glycosyltransferase [Pyrinomonadaceae bacterium]
MRIIYSFNKKGFEAECWIKEIENASAADDQFIAFNHGTYLDPNKYLEAYQLDDLYRERHPGLMQMYQDLEALIERTQAEAIFVTNCPPYHPEFLRTLPIYKALYSTDDTVSTYTRNIPYLHGYDHVLYCILSFSRDMDMQTKMRYCGMQNADWLPLGVFDFECDVSKPADDLFSQPRDIDVIYVGGFWWQKLDTLVQIRRAFGRRFKMYGFYLTKHNVYLNVRHRYGAWIRPVSFQERVSLYQRARIGFNLHYNEFMLGNQRLYHLPANGVMELSDCPETLSQVYEPGSEVVPYESTSDLIDKLQYYLKHEDERLAIARRGYQRTMRDYRFGPNLQQAAALLKRGMERIGWRHGEYVGA